MAAGELAAVLNWMLAAFGPQEVVDRVAPFDAEEVSRLRIPLTDVKAVRAGLVAELRRRQGRVGR